MVPLVRCTDWTYSMQRSAVLLVKSTAPHDPRLLELSVEPHVSHLCAVMHKCPLYPLHPAWVPSGSMEELCAAISACIPSYAACKETGNAWECGSVRQGHHTCL